MSKQRDILNKEDFIKTRESDFGYQSKVGFLRNLETFDPLTDDLEDYWFMVLSGRRRTGKTHWLAWFLSFPKRREKFKYVFVVTNTKCNGFWQKYVPDEYIIESWEPYGRRGVEEILSQQKEMLESGEPERQVLIILDDVIAEKVHDDDVIKRLATAGRHLKISVAITTQHHKSVGTWLRDNSDIAVIFNQRTERSLKGTYEDYLGVFRDEKISTAYIDNYTTGYGCLVFLNCKRENTPEKLVYKSEAPKEIPEYRLGSEEQWASFSNDPKKKRKNGGGISDRGQRSRYGVWSGDGNTSTGFHRTTERGPLLTELLESPF